MPKQTIIVPPSYTDTLVEIELPDSVNVTQSGGTPTTTSTSTTSTSTSTTTSSTTTSTTTSTSTTSTSTTTKPVVLGSTQGFGSQAIGGANSSNIIIVNTASQFTNAIGSNRIIKFGSSFTITGAAARIDLAGISYLTIDANGYDVTINNNNNGDAISFDGANTHHCILKGVRATNAGEDGINVVNGAHDIAIINCSSYGNRDGNIDVAGDTSGQTYNVTVQYCILGDNIGSGKMLVTGRNVSVHHNLFVSTSPSGEGAERNPFCHCNYSPVGSPNVDFRNNVISKYGRYGSGIGYKAAGNFIKNYYASSTSGAINPNADPSGNTSGNHAWYYVSGNYQVGGADINLGGGNHAEYIIPAWAQIDEQSACNAAKLVVAQAGTAVKDANEKAWLTQIVLANC